MVAAFEEEEAKGRGSFEQKFPEDGGGEASKARRRKERKTESTAAADNSLFLALRIANHRLPGGIFIP